MKIFIFGNKGNMGRRYASILKHLGHETEGCDYESFGRFPGFEKGYDGFIIATPTSTHLHIAHALIRCGKPVLCEKPFINQAEYLPFLQYFLECAEKESMQISMISQYDYVRDGNEGLTFYDFYQSGQDGIAWDCINIIWKARGKILLSNNSPIWHCRMNGLCLEADSDFCDYNFMNYAYIAMIKNWLENPYKPQYERILKSHQKVIDYINGKFD